MRPFLTFRRFEIKVSPHLAGEHALSLAPLSTSLLVGLVLAIGVPVASLCNQLFEKVFGKSDTFDSHFSLQSVDDDRLSE